MDNIELIARLADGSMTMALLLFGAYALRQVGPILDEIREIQQEKSNRERESLERIIKLLREQKE